MKLWQKNYFVTLALFLVFLYAGVFSLAFFSYRRSMSGAEETAKAEESYIARSFERDLSDMRASGSGASADMLMRSYVRHYNENGIRLGFVSKGDVLVSSFDGLPLAFEGGSIQRQSIDGERYVVISDPLEEAECVLVFAKNIEGVYREFKSFALICGAAAAGVSLLLAAVLLPLLKRLTVPLERLEETADRISGGELDVRADESGGDEFASLAKSFNTMVGRVNAQMDELKTEAETKQRLVDDMAHELRTPITAIRGYAEYLERAAVPEEERLEALSYIVSESDRLKRISEKILDSAFIRENEIKKEPVRLDEVLNEAARPLEAKAAGKGVTLRLETEPCEVKGDGVLLSMLFSNLIENAINACTEGGEVKAGCSGGAAFVFDNGRGMTEEQLLHITEPFYRTDKSRSRADGGAGLGLALCQRIASAHGTRLEYSSEPGKGTKVTVDLTALK
ncbi:MAG: HAMP domain-containing histidine kinase [Clostridia bacterium]|nr:HAMP domain-containing histidine kinase [Clostridia bacterium]